MFNVWSKVHEDGPFFAGASTMTTKLEVSCFSATSAAWTHRFVDFCDFVVMDVIAPGSTQLMVMPKHRGCIFLLAKIVFMVWGKVHEDVPFFARASAMTSMTTKLGFWYFQQPRLHGASQLLIFEIFAVMVVIEVYSAHGRRNSVGGSSSLAKIC